MIPKYVPILRAMKSELQALAQLSSVTRKNILPMFEIPIFTDSSKELVICRDKVNPKEWYLYSIVEKIAVERKNLPVLIDNSKWHSNSTIENGEHVLNYVINTLKRRNVNVIPVIGYDRWEDSEYSNALINIARTQDRFCIRLDSDAFEDMIDQNYFFSIMDDIIGSLSLDLNKCSVVLDFADITHTPIFDTQDKISNALNLLSRYGFEYTSIAGCSITTMINDMVPEQNSTSLVPRREMIAWQATKSGALSKNLVFGDYGVVSPNSGGFVKNKHANGKIRYTVDKNYFVVRGHSRCIGNKGEQMWELSQTVIDSVHYMGSNFSWGDNRILDCSKTIFKGNGGSWVEIDTNHHIQTVYAEVYEFEQKVPFLTPAVVIP